MANVCYLVTYAFLLQTRPFSDGITNVLMTRVTIELTTPINRMPRPPPRHRLSIEAAARHEAPAHPSYPSQPSTICHSRSDGPVTRNSNKEANHQMTPPRDALRMRPSMQFIYSSVLLSLIYCDNTCWLEKRSTIRRQIKQKLSRSLVFCLCMCLLSEPVYILIEAHELFYYEINAFIK